MNAGHPKCKVCSECVHCPICNAGVCVAEAVGGRVRCPSCGCLIKLEEKK